LTPKSINLKGKVLPHKASIDSRPRPPRPTKEY